MKRSRAAGWGEIIAWTLNFVAEGIVGADAQGQLTAVGRGARTRTWNQRDISPPL
jgi:hypothetical protein